ncbi:o-succinylbenzoate synthase [Xanthovirga aplysinae]|uniref:o-succinylbenzoate synthase n=1 Tax=Xanthovirga aplysinae TaxID=2529853 RepID=UPI0012BBE18F|nr:o-succinylbenzoate synthase [Xanthovirga aplysinae]MTI29730.1 o-succinylbenzoate synthase [Xanthovirga aplysinae]
MEIKTSCQKHILDFKFEAGTSRGVLRSKDTFWIKVCPREGREIFGLGEAGPLKGLSVDDRSDFEEICTEVLQQLDGLDVELNEEAIYAAVEEWIPSFLPSLRFGLETALLDLMNGGKRILFENSFSKGEKPISINGLIWMGEEEFMFQQIKDKLKKGFNCIKMKIGAIDFEREYNLLAFIRERFSKEDIVLRVDANGAFSSHEAMEKLERLAQLDLHSIEQPIKAGQMEKMRHLCKGTPLPIALDEELIGIQEESEKVALLETIQPQFIILKPTLLGGLKATREWIRLSEDRGIGWWVTSALESNIGLNAISQFTAEFPVEGIPQGLGTGQLYYNNIGSPLNIQEGKLFYSPAVQWDYSYLA